MCTTSGLLMPVRSVRAASFEETLEFYQEKWTEGVGNAVRLEIEDLNPDFDQELAAAIRRAFVPGLVAEIYKTSPLFDALLR